MSSLATRLCWFLAAVTSSRLASRWWRFRLPHSERVIPCRRIGLLALPLLTICPAGALQTGMNMESMKIKQEVLEIDRQHNEAMRANDADALSRIIADDCIFTNERGMVFGKSHRIDVTKSGKVVFSAYDIDDVNVQLHAGIAVVTERATTKGNDEYHTGQFRYTKVFARRNGRWQLVAAQKGFVLPAASAQSWSRQAEQEILKAKSEFDQAALRNDADGRARFYAEDYIAIPYDGTVVDRATQVQRVRSGALRYFARTAEDVRLRIYGDTALVTEHRKQRATGETGPRPSDVRASELWVRRNGEWRLEFTQITQVLVRSSQ